MSNKIITLLYNFILSRSPGVYLHTSEELRADCILTDLSQKLGYKPMEWNLAYGWVDFKNKSVAVTNAPEVVLLSSGLATLLDDELNNRLIIIKQADLALAGNQSDANSIAVARLHQLLNRIQRHQLNASVILVADTISIPSLIEGQLKLVELPVPHEQERNFIIKNVCQAKKLSVENKIVTHLVTACAGLSEQDIQQVLLMAISDENTLTDKTFDLILKEKRQIIAKSGVLEMIELDVNFGNIGGLTNIKNWLSRRAEIFERLPAAEKFGIQAPKGVLIAGMPGCGKSLTAKAAAELFQLPLLRLDIGSLLGKYVGDSESNMRRALKMAESISPCVLWIDELEKAFVGASGNNSSEVTARLLGYFLTWMQEKTSAVFVVATANNISVLPPELLRKGRFDEVFYVGFPNAIERQDIFKIHLKKATDRVEQFDLSELVHESRDYSGSDIQNVINEALEVAFVERKKCIEQSHLINAIKNTVPLRETIKDQIGKYEELFDKLKLKPASEEQGLSVSKMLEMAKNPNVVQREKVASDENCPEDIMDSLSADNNEVSVRLAVVKNENCPERIITSFINMKAGNTNFDQEIFDLAILHRNAPADLLARLIKENKLEDLLKDKLFTILVSLEQNTSINSNCKINFASTSNLTTEVQLKLINDELYEVRQSLAGNLNICEEVQRKLALDKNKRVRVRLAGNPKTITDVTEILLKDKDEEVVKKMNYFMKRRNK